MDFYINQDSDRDLEHEWENVTPEAITDNDNIADNEERDVIKLGKNNMNESGEDEIFEIESEEDNNIEREIEQNKVEQTTEQDKEIDIEINPPIYTKPKKKDEIIYFTKENDSWKEAVITSLISGYGNSWFNIQHRDGTKCSIELSQDSLWKFKEEESNKYYRWRWHHIDPGIRNDGEAV